MKIISKHLDKVVDRWISLKVSPAIHKTEFLNEFIANLKQLRHFLSNQVWYERAENIYKLYRLGKFMKVNEEINDFIKIVYMKNNCTNKFIIKEVRLKNMQFNPPPQFDKYKWLKSNEYKEYFKSATTFYREFILANEAIGKIENKYADILSAPVSEVQKDISVNLIEENKTLTEQDELPYEKRVCVFKEGIDIDTVIKHFSLFTTKASKNNGRPFLTDVDLQKFIDVAFYGKPFDKKLKFNYKVNVEKQIIQKHFYDFYFKFSTIHFKTVKVREKYINLLCNYFEDFSFDVLKKSFKTDARLSLKDYDDYTPDSKD